MFKAYLLYAHTLTFYPYILQVYFIQVKISRTGKRNTSVINILYIGPNIIKICTKFIFPYIVLLCYFG